MYYFLLLYCIECARVRSAQAWSIYHSKKYKKNRKGLCHWCVFLMNDRFFIFRVILHFFLLIYLCFELKHSLHSQLLELDRLNRLQRLLTLKNVSNSRKLGLKWFSPVQPICFCILVELSNGLIGRSRPEWAGIWSFSKP